MFLRLATSTALLAMLVGCGPDYSPNTYATNAVQQANKVEQGVVVGVRDVAVSASGTTGAITGGAAGGIAGAQVGTGPVSAFTALGGTLVGGLTGAAVEHATGDTKAFEYIVRKGNGDLVSVTQKDKVPLVLGQKVLVIAGNQARVVPDYTVNLTPSEKEKERAAAAEVAKAGEAGKPAEAGKQADGAGKPADGAKPADASAPPAAAPANAASASSPGQSVAGAAQAPSTSSAQAPGTAPPSPAQVGTAAPGAPATARGPSAVTSPASAQAMPGAPIRLTDPLPNPAGTAQPSTVP